MSLPADVQELLESILAKNPEDLTPDEVGFLNARRDYLNNEQKRVFQSVLRSQEELEQQATEAQAAQAVQPEVPPAPEVPEAPEVPVVEAAEPAVPHTPTQFVDDQGNPVVKPVQPEVPPAPVVPTEPAEPTVEQEPAAQNLTPAQPEQPVAGEVGAVETPDENPYDVDVADKDPDA